MSSPILERLATVSSLPEMSAANLRLFRQRQVEEAVATLRPAMPFGALACVAVTVACGATAGPGAWLAGGIVTVLILASIPLLGVPWVAARPQWIIGLVGVALAGLVGVLCSGAGGFLSPVITALFLLWLFAAIVAPLTPAQAVAHAMSHLITVAIIIVAASPTPGSPAVFLVAGVCGVVFLWAGLRLRERVAAQAFLLQRSLDAANLALAGMNVELERRVEEQVAKIRTHAHDVDVLNAQLQQRVIDRSRELALALARVADPARRGSLTAGAVLNGRVELVRCLDSGGMGEVFEGFDRLTQSKVAVKMILAKNLSDVMILQRFLTEARAAAAVQHPGIARTLDIDVTEHGTLFHVMELLEGETLADWMQRTPQRSLGAIARVGKVLAEALAAVHATGVVHRDVKPSNVMLIPGPPGAKLLDFGIAKLAALPDAGAETEAQTILGTPAYMAPEQALDSANVSSSADVYSLGILLYEALTGLLPHDGTDAARSKLAQVATPPVGLSARRPELPAPLAALVMRCIAREPSARPSATDVAHGLAPFTDARVAMLSSPGSIDANAPTALDGSLD